MSKYSPVYKVGSRVQYVGEPETVGTVVCPVWVSACDRYSYEVEWDGDTVEPGMYPAEELVALPKVTVS